MSALCWLNGVLLPKADARIDPEDRGFTLGDGLFETIAVRHGVPEHLARHLRRMRAGAAVLGIACDTSDQQIEDAIAMLADPGPTATTAARLTLSRGPSARGILPPAGARSTLLITLSPISSPLSGTEAIICRDTCRNEFSPLSRIKSINYLDNILARLEARKSGADEAVLLNTRGRIAEASTANIVLWQSGILSTPPISDGALPGIARAVLMETCQVREQSLTVQDLLAADAVMLTSSLGVRAITRLEQRDYAPVPTLLARMNAALHGAPVSGG